MTCKIVKFAAPIGLLILGLVNVHAGDDLNWNTPDGSAYTGFSNTGSVANTRHNMTQSTLTPFVGGSGLMSAYRNDYGEVCVYCHTPHGANTNVKAPLWNRNLPATTYTTYDQLNTISLTQTVYQPGAASLPCLSCHDGQQAVDAIINMPGSGRYNATPSSAPGTGGDLWKRWNVVGKRALNHASLTAGTTGQECLSCHSPDGNSAAVDFTVAAIGTDLRNDHPVGVTFPTVNGSGTDWKTPNGTKVVAGMTNQFFDETPNGRMDKGEIRLYDSGNGASVECASCHDPHGVPSGGAGSMMIPTFLRKTNSGSAVCLTCHSK